MTSDKRRREDSISRRNFIKKSSLAPLAGFLSAREFMPLAGKRRRMPTVEDRVTCAVIGFGQWGREIASTLDRIPEARLAAVCDTYDVMLKRAERLVPDVTGYTDYRRVLDDSEIKAVIIATPTHLHRDLVIDALAAGKNVYCEAPIASTVDDARAIATAAAAAPNQIFQAGLMFRSDPQHRNIFQFIRSGAIGRPTMLRAQWHAKESWRRASPSRDREAELNWRLDERVSIGLAGEVGTHQIDTASWILRELPLSVSGFGQIILWDDGRKVPDTVQAVIEFPRDVHMLYDATLTSSFDGSYDMFYGSDSTIMLRDSKGWMFKEVDAPMLGWEVYARKDTFYRERGIALVANATKLEAQGLDPAEDDPNVETPLFYGLKDFVDNNIFGPYEPASNALVGYRAAVMAIKTNEAIVGKSKIQFDPAWFEV